MALAKNGDALKNFGSLDDTKRQEIINESRMISSKPEMQSFVENLGKTVG